jgi:hypothetical protein
MGARAEGEEWPRAQRLDATRVAGLLAERAGVRLEIEGPCPGGQVGAAYVRWPDGRQGVLTWRPRISPGEFRAGAQAVADTLRAVGYQAPATQLVAEVGDGIAVVQQRLPGRPAAVFTGALVDQAVALSGLHAGALAEVGSVPPMMLYLRGDGPGYCLHGPLRGYDARTRRLLGWVHSVAGRWPDELTGDDAVHCDFQPTNFLVLDGEITGVVDWGAARGDRRLDLVTLRFGVHGELAEPGVAAVLDAILDEVPADALAPLWAHMSLRMVDWAIRHFDAAAVAHWLDLAEQRAG